MGFASKETGNEAVPNRRKWGAGALDRRYTISNTTIHDRTAISRGFTTLGNLLGHDRPVSLGYSNLWNPPELSSSASAPFSHCHRPNINIYTTVARRRAPLSRR